MGIKGRSSSPRRSRRPDDRPRRLAAVDVGTNSIHMVVVSVDPQTGGFTILAREKERVRLGEGSGDMKFLSGPAMERGVTALRRFGTIAGRFGAPVTAVATSAVREAVNGDIFIRRIAAETGIRLGIVSGLEEARLIYLGVLQALPVLNKHILLVDLGGGSTEFLAGKRRRVLYDNSLKIGAIRITDRFFPAGVVSAGALRECRKYIRGLLTPVRRDLKKFRFDLTVGTSGTLTNLANIVRCCDGLAPLASYNSYTVDAGELLDAASLILETPKPSGRLRIPGLDPTRSDIIAGGAAIIEQVIRELRIPSVTISEFALREGIIRDAAERSVFHTGTPGLHDIRLASVRHLAKKLQAEMEHSEQVASLALSLFDQTAALHRGDRRDRELLEAASILHEAGLFISHEKHHQHSYYLIRNAELLGFREDEKEIIANVARYHRKSHPKLKHEPFGLLPESSRRTVRALSALLRIADGLDRTHRGVVAGIRVSVTRNTVRIRPRIRRGMDAELEIWGAGQKKELFEEEFGRKVKISR